MSHLAPREIEDAASLTTPYLLFPNSAAGRDTVVIDIGRVGKIEYAYLIGGD
jgi:hypothetical protein